MDFGRSVDVKLVLALVRHYSGRSMDVKLVLALVRHYSGRSVDVNSDSNVGVSSCLNCDVIASTKLEYFYLPDYVVLRC